MGASECGHCNRCEDDKRQYAPYGSGVTWAVWLSNGVLRI